MEVKDTLSRYEPYADQWMKHVSMHRYPKVPLGRMHSFRYVFNEMAKLKKRVIIVELGTSRSFVDGAFPGCNSDDEKYWDPNDISKWDYGAGAFTYMCAEFMTKNHTNFKQFTVDIASSHIERCKVMTRPFARNISYVVKNSLDFLKTFGTKCDLIYLDTGDMTPIEPTAQLQMMEAKLIVAHKLLAPGGFILIDDVRNPCALDQDGGDVLGKAKYSIPFFKKHGFEVVFDEYQVILTKK